MIDKISNKLLVLLSNNNQTEDEKEVLLFGITRIVEDVPKYIGIVLLGILLDVIKEMVIITIIIALYKSLVGGVHAKTNWGCFFHSVLFYLAIIYSSKYLIFTGIVKCVVYILIYIFALYSIFVYVPADVPEIPKVNQQLRNKLKLQSIVMLNLIYIITIMMVRSTVVQNIIIYSVFFINLMTIRTVYKLFKSEYGYITYIPDELI